MINGDNCKNTVKNTNGSIFCLYIRFIFYSLAGGLRLIIIFEGTLHEETSWLPVV